jgi:hypothetical protein
MWMTVIEIVGLVFCGSRVIVSPDVTCDNLSGQNSEDGNKLKRKHVVTSVGQQKKSIAFVVFSAGRRRRSSVNQETPCTGNVRKSSLESSAYTYLSHQDSSAIENSALLALAQLHHHHISIHSNYTCLVLPNNRELQ